MNVTEIRFNPVNAYDIINFKPKESDKKAVDKAPPQNDVNAINSWQKDILLGGLNKLENNLHLDDINPLDRSHNQPIETHQEALDVLSFVKTQLFKDQASGAQANIKPQDVMDLFTGKDN